MGKGGTDVEAGQRAASTGPTCRRQREAARRAVAFVEAKCPAGGGGVICDSLTGGPDRRVHTGRRGARAWAGPQDGRSAECLDDISRPRGYPPSEFVFPQKKKGVNFYFRGRNNGFSA